MSSKKLTIQLLDKVETARRLLLTLHNSHNRVIPTPNYILSTRGGTLNGIIKHNLKDTNYTQVALNLHDMHEYTETLTKFKEHLGKSTKPLACQGLPDSKSTLKRFFRFEDKLVWLTPFSYSEARERIGGFNDEEHFLVNSKTKMHVKEYFKMAEEFGPDFVVTPCE
jgi:hypothetical protein